MKAMGTIKFVDQRTAAWGYIIPNDGSLDVHFDVADCDGPAPSSADEGSPVEYELAADSDRRHALTVHLLLPPAVHPTTPTAPRNELRCWAFVPPFTPFRAKDGREYSSVLDYLARLALEERWHFGTAPDPRVPFPILDRYLKYTFVRLRRENKVHESDEWATFNTGLVDRLYDPIFALFDKNHRPGCEPWRFCDFCIPGKGPSGKTLTNIFDPLPDTARYFSSNFEMIFDTSKDFFVDYEHVILDGVTNDRFPPEFLREHLPEGFDWQDTTGQTRAEREAYLTKLSQAIKADARCMRAIKRRLEDAKLLAEKRIRWNYKTAIPQYYPHLDLMSFLLPIALINDEVVDIALVATRNQSGSYQGRTILPLDWAYANARLVCRPDSDWLVPQNVRAPVEIPPEDLHEDVEA